MRSGLTGLKLMLAALFLFVVSTTMARTAVAGEGLGECNTMTQV